MRNMKRILGIAVLAVLSMGLFAQDAPIIGSWYKPGNTVFGLAAAYETDYNYPYYNYLGIYPSAEMILWSPKFGDYAPLDFGVSAEGRLGLPLEKGAGVTIGAAGEGTIHVGFRGFDFPYAEYLDRLDLYARIGISFDIVHPDGSQLGLVATSGANYFLDDRLMVGLAYTGWGTVDGVSINVRYRMGKTPTVKGMEGAWDRLGAAVDTVEAMGPVSQFYALFFYSVYTGGYYWNGDTFEEGTGTVWHYWESDEDTFHMERVLLEKSDEGEWWRLRYFNEDGDEYTYEYLLSPEKELVKMFYRDDSDRVKIYEFTDKTELTYLSEEGVVSYEDMSELAENREDVTVPAGTFKDCAHLADSVEGEDYDWWFADSDKVPGRMIKFRSDDGSTVVNGELTEILTGKTGDFQLR